MRLMTMDNFVPPLDRAANQGTLPVVLTAGRVPPPPSPLLSNITP
jgi:hypothetical protein